MISPSWLQMNKRCKRLLENKTVNDNRQFPRLHIALLDIRKCLSVILIWLCLPFYDHDNQGMWILKFKKKYALKLALSDLTLKLSYKKIMYRKVIFMFHYLHDSICFFNMGSRRRWWHGVIWCWLCSVHKRNYMQRIIGMVLKNSSLV